MSWWRQNWRLAIAICISFIGLIVIGLLMLRRQKAAADKLARDLQILQGSAAVKGLEADRAARAKELAANEERAAQVDMQIAQAKKDVVLIAREVDDMSLDQAVLEFERLGY